MNATCIEPDVPLITANRIFTLLVCIQAITLNKLLVYPTLHCAIILLDLVDHMPYGIRIVLIGYWTFNLGLYFNRSEVKPHFNTKSSMAN
jgi:hypothetical protein